MAQHDYVIANGTGAAVRSDLNNALAAIVSQNSGATAPATTYAFQFWADTTTGLLKLRNSANSAWVTLFQLDGEWSTLPVENGTAAAPSIYFKDSGTDTGFYSPGADQVAISTGGSGRLFINSAGTVSIGTASPSPSSALEVYATAPVLTVNSATGNPSSIVLQQAGTTYARFRFDGNNVDIGNLYSGGATILNAGNAERLRITSAGLVGIGTTSVKASLDIGTSAVASAQANTLLALESTVSSNWIEFCNSGTTNNAGIQWSDAGSSDNASIYYDNNTGNLLYKAEGSQVFRTNGGNERARIDSSGRLLVGTSSAPTGSSTQYAKLVVRGNTATSNESYLVLGRNSAASVDQPLGSIWFADNADGQFARIEALCDATPGASDFPGRLVFSTTADGASSPTERMRISNGGYTSFNTTSVIGSARVSIAQDFNAANGLGIQNTGAQGGGQYFALFYNSAGTLSGTIAHNGTATVAFNTSSDYRLKENIAPISDGITRLRQLIPSRFNFIDEPDKTVDGFIAHEVQEVIPEAVTGEKDAVNEDGSIHPQGIDQSKLVPLLTAALQEAIGEIESLKARVAALESA